MNMEPLDIVSDSLFCMFVGGKDYEQPAEIEETET
jgi:hypothetical protein